MNRILESSTCYDILPHSYKVIVFDQQLLVKKALSALLQNGVQSAPIWDTTTHQFVGMLTVTDFIQLILYYFDRSTPIDQALEEIDDLTIISLRDLEMNVLRCLPSNNIIVTPNDTLLAASKLLINNKLHRLPIIDSMENSDQILSVLTQIKILRFLASSVCTNL